MNKKMGFGIVVAGASPFSAGRTFVRSRSLRGAAAGWPRRRGAPWRRRPT